MIAGLCGALLLAAVPAHAGLCDLLSTCPAPPPSSDLDPDGALHVATDMMPLPGPQPGRPLFDRVDGHLPLGLTERGYDGSPNGSGRAATAAQEAAFVRGIGGTMLRVPVLWGHAEPAAPLAGVHTYGWERDDLYRGLVTHGVRPILTLLGAPRWALNSSAGCEDVCEQPPVGARMDDFAAFAAAVARRYPLAAAIEIWNEPNNHHGSVQGPDPAAYTALLAKAYDAIKAQRPQMRVLGGALGAYGAGADQPTTASDVRLGDFLGVMLDSGAGAHMDGLSLHPYPNSLVDNPANDFFRVFSVVTGVLDAHGAGAERLVASEFGVPTTDALPGARSRVLQDRWHDLNDPDPAAAYPVPGRDRVDGVVFHTDISGIDYDRYGWLSVVTNQTTFRPQQVWCDFARLLAGHQTCPITIRPART
ncbi:MAG: polysaccharide biosynthesis protein PslG [Solirubrobacteraceae bacterium]|nr:polysaccharide biosynthesis protein PslG [Solirubrobacteraceae bacterium]